MKKTIEPLVKTVLPDGTVLFHPIHGTEKMLVPVKCNRCGKIYDLCGVEVIHRHQDCTLYTTPCCNQNVDDREWVGYPAFTRMKNIPKEGLIIRP